MNLFKKKKKKLPFPIVMVDLETTNVTIVGNSILQVGLIAIDEDCNIKEATLIEVRLPKTAEWGKGAEAVHKITHEYALENGSSHPATLDAVNEFMRRNYPDTKAIACGFNVQFDMKLLEYFFAENNVELPFSHRIHELDTLGRHLFGTNKSKELCEALKIKADPTKLHNALYDCTLGLEVLRKI